MTVAKEKAAKPRPDLVPASALLAMGRVLQANMDKHGDPRKALGNPDHPNGAREANEASIMRHVLAWMEGESHDPDTGEHHLAHAMVRMAYMVHREAKVELKQLHRPTWHGGMDDGVFGTRLPPGEAPRRGDVVFPSRDGSYWVRPLDSASEEE